MPTHTGTEGSVKIDENNIAEVRSWSLSEEGETADTTTLDNTDGWRTHKHTLKAWSGEIEAFWDETDIDGQVSLSRGSSVNLNLYPQGDATGDNYYSGVATVTDANVSAAIDGIVEAKFTFQGNGVLNRGDVI